MPGRRTAAGRLRPASASDGRRVVELFVLLSLGFVISAVCAFWCATRALAKGYSPAVWGVLGFLVPVIAVIAMAVMPETDRAP